MTPIAMAPVMEGCCGSMVEGMPMGHGMLMPQTNLPVETVLTSADGVPGTLGMTYKVPSRRITADKHRRIGQVEITVGEETFESLVDGEEIKVVVADEAAHFAELEGYYGEDEKWHFESKPLYPTIPNIYDAAFSVVKMEKKKERRGDKVVEWEFEKKVRDLGVRRFRLIPGREVKVNFP